MSGPSAVAVVTKHANLGRTRMCESVLQGALSLPLEQKKSLIETLRGRARADVLRARGRPGRAPEVPPLPRRQEGQGRARPASGCARGAAGRSGRPLRGCSRGRSSRRGRGRTAWSTWWPARRSGGAPASSARRSRPTRSRRTSRSGETYDASAGDGRVPEVTEDDLRGPEAMSDLV